MENELSDMIEEVQEQKDGNFVKDLLRYIPIVREFLIKNKDLPRNQKSEDFGILNSSKPQMRFKRSINVANNDGEIRPFTNAFAQFCLQVAINMSPYQTGNLRDNLALSWSSNHIEILFNAKGTATYTMYLDNGYPNAKWKGFIKNIRVMIIVLCSWYQSQDKDDISKLNQAMKVLGKGGKMMKSLKSLNDNTRAEKIVLRRASVTGWERTRIEKGRKTITPMERAQTSKTTSVRKSKTKTIAREKMAREKQAIKGTQIRYERQIKNRSNNKSRGG